MSKHSMGRVVRQKSERDGETAIFFLYVTGTRIVCVLNQFTRGRHALLCGPRSERSIRSVEACVARGWICGFVDQLKRAPPEVAPFPRLHRIKSRYFSSLHI